MKDIYFRYICDTMNVGLIVIDKEFCVHYWNRWMELHSKIKSEEVSGKSLLLCFPVLDNQSFLRACKMVFAFGNHSFFSQKLHSYLLPFTVASTSPKFQHMQQSCTFFPLRNEGAIDRVCIAITDVTEVADYENRLVGMAHRDPLTGLYNRRYFKEKFTQEFERAKRYNSVISVIMFDIDHFKLVNDTYGHQCGDLILSLTARKIHDCLRISDFLSRYGGEEFCCVLPETDVAGSLVIAERIRESITTSEFMYLDKVVKITISSGISQFSSSTADTDALLREADTALYTAKKTGRNKVVCYSQASIKPER